MRKGTAVHALFEPHQDGAAAQVALAAEGQLPVFCMAQLLQAPLPGIHCCKAAHQRPHLPHLHAKSTKHQRPFITILCAGQTLDVYMQSISCLATQTTSRYQGYMTRRIAPCAELILILQLVDRVKIASSICITDACECHNLQPVYRIYLSQ